MSRGEIFAFTAGERAVVHGKGHLDGRFVDRHPRECDRTIRVGDGVADVHFFQTAQGDDFAGFRRFDIGALKP